MMQRTGLIRDRRRPEHRAQRVYGMHPGAALPDVAQILGDAQMPILHQGRLNSCAAHAVAEAIFLRALVQWGQRTHVQLASEFTWRTRDIGAWMPSRNWLYCVGRVRAGNGDRDSGVSFADVFAAAAALGFPPESAWTYDGHKSGDPEGDGAPADAFRRMPDDAPRLAYDQRGRFDLEFRALDETALDFVDVVRHAVAVDDCPVVVGVDVDEAFIRGDFDPAVPLDLPDRSSSGHAMLCVGYERLPSGEFAFLLRNSWGPDFGVGGRVRVTERYLRSGEAWVVGQVPVLPVGGSL